MAKKQSGSSVRESRRGRSGKGMRRDKIDFSDIPELSSAQLKKARRVGRPSTGNAKQLIAIRVAPELLAQLKKIADEEGRPYQSLMHEMLEKAIKRRAA